MTTISATSILASRHAITGDRLDTLVLQMPRIILAEANTHRALSKNTSSTRAIPTKRLIEQVATDPFIPLHWGAAQKGMQAYEEIADAAGCEKTWLKARDRAVKSAEELLALGLHKQVVGRVLEPWMWVTTVATGSDYAWDNFFALRDHPDAEPHIQLLAQAIRKARDEAVVQSLEPGEWHVPFVDPSKAPIYTVAPTDPLKNLLKISVACCASVSYKTVEGFDMTQERAEAIYDKLFGPPLHASPFEHAAQADWRLKRPVYLPGGLLIDTVHEWANETQHRNFRGFRQLRALIEDAYIPRSHSVAS